MNEPNPLWLELWFIRQRRRERHAEAIFTIEALALAFAALLALLGVSVLFNL